MNIREIKLDIGCGRNKKVGYVGLDKTDYPEVDYVVDISKELLPYSDESVDEVYSHHTLEHIDGPDRVFVMNEIWRVLKPGGRVEIHVPHKDCALSSAYYGHRYPPFILESFQFFRRDYLSLRRQKYWDFDGNKTGFVLDSLGVYVPEGEDPLYCTMIKAVMAKEK